MWTRWVGVFKRTTRTYWIIERETDKSGRTFLNVVCVRVCVIECEIFVLAELQEQKNVTIMAIEIAIPVVTFVIVC